jgi:hypothetical protein
MEVPQVGIARREEHAFVGGEARHDESASLQVSSNTLAAFVGSVAVEVVVLGGMAFAWLVILRTIQSRELKGAFSCR